MLTCHVALLLACLGIARVESRLRRQGRLSWIRNLRVTQAICVGGIVAIGLFVGVVAIGIGSAVAPGTAPEVIALGAGATEAPLESAIAAIMIVTTTSAVLAASLSLYVVIFSLFPARRGAGSAPVVPASGGVADALRWSIWSALPLIAEAGLLVLDGVAIMDQSVDPLAVLTVVLIVIAAAPGLLERRPVRSD